MTQAFWPAEAEGVGHGGVNGLVPGLVGDHVQIAQGSGVW